MGAPTGNHNGLSDVIAADICIIGAGEGGLTVATAAAQLGARTVLIDEQGTATGRPSARAVPSRAILSLAQVAETMRGARRLGLAERPPELRFADIQTSLRGVIDGFAARNANHRLTELGCLVLKGRGRFVGPDAVQTGTAMVRARRFVVATGSRPLVPNVPGLDITPHFTSETIFDNAACPDHLIVIGGGRFACELAQAHRRLGARVTLLERTHILADDDPELTAVVKMQLLAEGVAILEEIELTEIRLRGNRVTVTIRMHGAMQEIDGSHLLVADGRTADAEGLGLEAAQIVHTPAGIKVDHRLRTTNRRVFAIGSVVALPGASHAASAHAAIIVRNALFRIPARICSRAIPAVTYTDPELAHVGLTERQARECATALRVLRLPFSENDRAQAERRTSGQIKIVATPRGEVLGASIVGAHAGELLQPWIIAIEQRLKLGALARMSAPHPTLSEISRRVASDFLAPTLFGTGTRHLVRFLSRFG
jgi:pyruvate/2-oxoglutarate dehydrogenase complex dihydrolipoamide dehydrogenase (E3) component